MGVAAWRSKGASEGAASSAVITKGDVTKKKMEVAADADDRDLPPRGSPSLPTSWDGLRRGHRFFGRFGRVDWSDWVALPWRR